PALVAVLAQGFLALGVALRANLIEPRATRVTGSYRAPAAGIEPTFADPKTAVLPLDDAGIGPDDSTHEGLVERIARSDLVPRRARVESAVVRARRLDGVARALGRRA